MQRKPVGQLGTPWVPADDPADALLAELTRATGDSAVELANPQRDAQSVLDGLLAMIADLGGQEGIQSPNPAAEADPWFGNLRP
jgi:hypothetical protein